MIGVKNAVLFLLILHPDIIASEDEPALSKITSRENVYDMDTLMDTRYSYYPFDKDAIDSKLVSRVPHESRTQSRMKQTNRSPNNAETPAPIVKYHPEFEMLKNLMTPRSEFLHNYIIDREYSERRTVDNLLSSIPDLAHNFGRNFPFDKIGQRLRKKRFSNERSRSRDERKSKKTVRETGIVKADGPDLSSIAKNTPKRKREIISRGIKLSNVWNKPKKQSYETFKIVLPVDRSDLKDNCTSNAKPVRQSDSAVGKTEIFKIKTKNGQQLIAAISDLQQPNARKNSLIYEPVNRIAQCSSDNIEMPTLEVIENDICEDVVQMDVPRRPSGHRRYDAMSPCCCKNSNRDLDED